MSAARCMLTLHVQLVKWKAQIEKDMERLKTETNRQNIKGGLDRSNIHCELQESTMLKNQILSQEYVDKVIGWSLSHHLMNSDTVEIKNEKLVILPRSVDFGINMLENTKPQDRHVCVITPIYCIAFTNISFPEISQRR